MLMQMHGNFLSWPPKFQLKDCKMTFAYNSAYIQTETLNFTFARQALCILILNINIGLLADGRHNVTAAPCSGMSILHVSFCQCSQTPASTSNLSTSSLSQWNVDSNDLLSIRKYLSTFHAQVKYISVTKYAIETIWPMGANDPKIHPSHWGTWTIIDFPSLGITYNGGWCSATMTRWNS